MKKILYIHIGTGKTGTTSIQNFLSENQKNGRLSKHFNTRYCFSGRPNINNILLCKNYQRGNEKTQELINANIRELRKEIYQSSEQLFIISSEYFPGNTQDEIHELVNTVSDICQVKIIVYLRRQDDFLWSWYTQLVKTTNIFIDIYKLKDKLYKGPQQVFNYETSLRKWENIVGKENILVNIYDSNNFKENSIYFDFFQNLNIYLDLKKMIVPEEVNLSLQCEQICLIQTLVPYVSEWNDEQLKMLQKPLNIPFLYTKSLLSPRERKEILNDFRQHNEFVARRYLNQENLFDENIEDEDTWREPNIFNSGYFEKYIDYIKTEKKTLFELLQPILKNVNRMKIKTVRNMLLVNNIFIVDWTEKAGCTIVCKMFFDVMGILQEALDYNSWIHNYRQDKFYEKFGKVTEDMLSGDKFVKMKFVRNPYTRAVSSYFAANENNKQYLKGYEHLDLSFYDFLLLVKQKKIVNDHWRTQYQEIESRFNFDEIIKIENIEQEVKRLNQKYSLNLQLHTHSSHHHKKDKNKSEFVGRKKYSELEISSTIPDYRNFYDDETKLLVSEIYEKDLKTYNYTFDLEKNQERIKAENTEITFWRNWVQTDRFTRWCTETPNRELNPEIDLLLCHYAEIEKRKLNVLDVGSGPISILSRCTASKQISLVAVDPLAPHYDNLLPPNINEYDVITPINVQAEALSSHFEANHFDVVHIRNALGHTIDPVISLEQLHLVTKPNGLIIVHGFENEGETENWAGMHQWNLYLENGDLYISNKSGIVDNTNNLYGDSVARVYSRTMSVPVNPKRPPTNWMTIVFKKLKKKTG